MKLQFKVYRQASKDRSGYTVYKGEDARPYVGKNCLLVADGLGGAAAIRHTKFNAGLADKDKLIKTLFGSVFNLPVPEELEDYIQLSFSEFLDIVGHYSDTNLNIKKSGYFGSRIVTALFLYEILGYDRDFPTIKAIFNDYKDFKSNRKKREYLDQLGNDLKNIIKTNLRQAAKDANLIYETGISGMALLGTTLCATLYNEMDDYVEAIYLVAGDSRPYMWDESGLYQVAADQEGADGGMTNYIKANPDADFYIDCTYHKFKKPCLLFNASDGIFDSKYFHSQMALEKLILETIVSQPDMEAVGKSITETFLEYGHHDDSSTIAATAFGYESYAELQKAAAKRLEEINKKYLEKVPDLLVTDYAQLIEERKQAALDDSKKIAVKLKTDPAVRNYCKDSVLDLESLNEKHRRLALRMEQEVVNIERIKEEICQIIKDNFVCFACHYCKFFGMVASMKYNYSNSIVDNPERYKRENNVIAEGERDIFNYVVDKVFSSNSKDNHPEELIAYEDDCLQFISLMEKLKTCDAGILPTYRSEYMKILDEEISAYIDRNYLDIVKEIVRNTIVTSKELRKEAIEVVASVSDSEDSKKLEAMKQAQEELFAEYEEGYLSLLNQPAEPEEEEEEEEEEDEPETASKPVYTYENTSSEAAAAEETPAEPEKQSEPAPAENTATTVTTAAAEPAESTEDSADTKEDGAEVSADTKEESAPSLPEKEPVTEPEKEPETKPETAEDNAVKKAVVTAEDSTYLAPDEGGTIVYDDGDCTHVTADTISGPDDDVVTKTVPEDNGNGSTKR